MTVRLSPDLAPEWFRVEPTNKTGFEHVEDVARVPEGSVVVGMTVDNDTTDLRVLAFDDPYEADPLWSRAHSPANLDERCTDLALGPYGAIYYVGISDEKRFIAGEFAP